MLIFKTCEIFMNVILLTLMMVSQQTKTPFVVDVGKRVIGLHWCNFMKLYFINSHLEC